MKRVSSRDFKVDYYEKERDVWVVESKLVDEPHDIGIVLEIDMAQMTVTDAKIKFNRFPIEHCPLIEAKTGQLIGLKVDQKFMNNVMKIFMGPQGCPNIATLLAISVPGIIYYYYPHKIKTGEMQPDQWWHMVKTELKDACLAHTLL